MIAFCFHFNHLIRFRSTPSAQVPHPALALQPENDVKHLEIEGSGFALMILG